MSRFCIYCLLRACTSVTCARGEGLGHPPRYPLLVGRQTLPQSLHLVRHQLPVEQLVTDSDDDDDDGHPQEPDVTLRLELRFVHRVDEVGDVEEKTDDAEEDADDTTMTRPRLLQTSLHYFHAAHAAVRVVVVVVVIVVVVVHRLRHVTLRRHVVDAKDYFVGADADRFTAVVT